MKIILKIVKESALLAIKELRINPLRTILSLLGISIGIFCVISVFTAVDSLEAKVQGSVQKLGSEKIIYIQKWPWEFGGDYPWWKYWKRPVAKYEELEIIKENVKSAEASAIRVDMGDKLVQYKNNRIENANIVGISGDYEKIYDFKFEKGRYFSLMEAQTGKNVAFIGHSIAEELFPAGVDPLGKQIRAYGKKFKIIGVLEKEGEDIFRNSFDKSILVPYLQLKTFINTESGHVEPFIVVKGKAEIPERELIAELRSVMRAMRKLKPKEEDDFSLNQISVFSNQVSQMFGVINIAGLLIGIFSIIVGGFGIANIMFVSVKERTNIIGIKKALGAKSYFILLEFLIESTLLSILGGLIGLFIVFAGTVIAKHTMDFDLSLTLNNITWGIIISCIIGLIAGFLPAFQASKLDPVVAIRQ